MLQFKKQDKKTISRDHHLNCNKFAIRNAGGLSEQTAQSGRVGEFQSKDASIKVAALYESIKSCS